MFSVMIMGSTRIILPLSVRDCTTMVVSWQQNDQAPWLVGWLVALNPSKCFSTMGSSLFGRTPITMNDLFLMLSWAPNDDKSECELELTFQIKTTLEEGFQPPPSLFLSFSVSFQSIQEHVRPVEFPSSRDFQSTFGPDYLIVNVTFSKWSWLNSRLRDSSGPPFVSVMYVEVFCFRLWNDVESAIGDLAWDNCGFHSLDSIPPRDASHQSWSHFVCSNSCCDSLLFVPKFKVSIGEVTPRLFGDTRKKPSFKNATTIILHSLSPLTTISNPYFKETFPNVCVSNQNSKVSLNDTLCVVLSLKNRLKGYWNKNRVIEQRKPYCRKWFWNAETYFRIEAIP